MQYCEQFAISTVNRIRHVIYYAWKLWQTDGNPDWRQRENKRWNDKSEFAVVNSYANKKKR